MVAATKTKPSTRPATTGAIIDQLWASREESVGWKSKSRRSYAIKGIEETLMERRAEGLENYWLEGQRVYHLHCHGCVQDWDAFYPTSQRTNFGICCSTGHPIGRPRTVGRWKACRVVPSLNGGSTSALSPDL